MRIGVNRLKHLMIKDREIHVHILIIVNILLAGVAFLKDILLASYFGTSSYADSLYLAFFMPDMVGNNLLGAAIGISCIPIFTKRFLSQKQEFFNHTINKVIIITILLALCFIVALLPVAKWLFTYLNLPGDQTFHYFVIMILIILFSPIVIIAASILQVLGNFTKPAVMPIILNLILLVAIVICKLRNYPLGMGGYVYASALLISTGFIAFYSWYFVFRAGDISVKFLRHPILLLKNDKEDIRLFFRIFTPYFIILLSQQSVFLFERLIALNLETGTISGLTYAHRISQFPIWVFIAAINTVLLPTISKHMETNNMNHLKKELIKSFQIVVTISLIVSITLFLFGKQLISILFLQGAFNHNSLRITSAIFSGYALSILGQSIYLLCLRFFVASGRMMIPLYTSIIGCFIHIILLYIFISLFGSNGIGYAAAIGFTLLGAFSFYFVIKDIDVVEKKGGKIESE